jgi:hypothetical protein
MGRFVLGPMTLLVLSSAPSPRSSSLGENYSWLVSLSLALSIFSAGLLSLDAYRIVSANPLLLLATGRVLLPSYIVFTFNMGFSIINWCFLWPIRLTTLFILLVVYNVLELLFTFSLVMNWSVGNKGNGDYFIYLFSGCFTRIHIFNSGTSLGSFLFY